MKRKGFTLVELLVVIAIIAVLAGLLLAGVNALWGKKALVTTETEILEFNSAMELFKTKYSVYPPSSITVSANPKTMATVLAADLAILQKIWPKINVAQAFGAAGMNVAGTKTLSGDQCLVLFLGGRHKKTGANANGALNYSTCEGFSTDPTNPFAQGGDRTQPFFKFKVERLFQRDKNADFASYGDGWFGESRGGSEQFPCYAYFAPRNAVGSLDYQPNDCSALKDYKGNAPKPYQDVTLDPATKTFPYLNPNSFQVISSGHDSQFGTKFQWVPGNALKLSPEEMDNITNFSKGLLSAN